MKKEGKFIMGTHKAIYQPKGAAREYSAWACNLYNGCTNQCDYCYCKRGVLSYTLGLSKPVLKKTVGKDDKEAFETFKRELAMYKDNIINDGTGLFFSFSTDPMLLEELPLTTLCVNECVKNDVPVQILTKKSYWVHSNIDFMNYLFSNWYDKVKIGFTLTGHDELEPYADSSLSRILECCYLIQNGVDTFVSLEPIVSFEDSLRMIKNFIHNYCFPNEFRIGLMSGVDKKTYYDWKKCDSFIREVKELALQYDFTVKWKNSIVTYYNKGFE